jgi:hypothetical protein
VLRIMIDQASGVLAEEPASILHGDPTLEFLNKLVTVVRHFSLP